MILRRRSKPEGWRLFAWVAAALGVWRLGDMGVHSVASATFGHGDGPTSAAQVAALGMLGVLGALYVVFVDRLIGMAGAIGLASAVLVVTCFQYAAAVAWSLGSLAGLGTLDGWQSAEYLSQIVAMASAVVYLIAEREYHRRQDTA